MLLFAGLAFKVSPYVDPINDKMDHVSRCALHYTLHRSRQQIHAHYHGLCVGDFQPLCCRSAGFSIMMTIYVMACCQTKMKGYTGTLFFTDPNGITLEGSPQYAARLESGRGAQAACVEALLGP